MARPATTRWARAPVIAPEPRVLLATRKLRSGPTGQVVELNEAQRPHDRFTNVLLLRILVPVLQRERDVLENRHMRPDRVALEDHADVALMWRDEFGVLD